MTEGKPSLISYLDEKILEEICHDIATILFAKEEPMGLYKDNDPGKVASCLSLPRQSAFGQELYPGVFKKAAITFYAFNRNHAFGNGNKRLSVVAFVVFLYINDYEIRVPTDELRDKALWIAQTSESVEKVVNQLAQWAEKNSVNINQQE